MSPVSYLITGANRGIGFALVETLLAQGPSNVVIFAGARNVASSKDLNALAAKYPGSVIPVQLKSGDVEDHASAAKLIDEKVGSLDVVIANAGIANSKDAVSQQTVANIVEHFQVNTVGPVVLYQAALPLLKKSKTTPKFVAISTLAGSLNAALRIPFPISAYGASKAALNYFLLKIHQEEEGLITFPVHPGMVDSDMGLEAKSAWGPYWQGITPQHSAESIIKLTQGATREATSGKFWNYDGAENAW